MIPNGRLDTTLAELDAKGVLASGRVVATDPYTAVLDVVESSDPPSEIIISTLPHTRSGWARRDLIRRIRDRVDLPVTHVENDIAADQTHDTARVTGAAARVDDVTQPIVGAASACTGTP